MDVVEALGLEQCFNHLILSCEVKAKKLDRQIYLEAFRGLELKLEECIFVADEISDLEGARDVGLKTCLVRQGPNTTREAKDLDFKPDLECNHISEITKFI